LVGRSLGVFVGALGMLSLNVNAKLRQREM
jgi:hypothetical protein